MGSSMVGDSSDLQHRIWREGILVLGRREGGGGDLILLRVGRERRGWLAAVGEGGTHADSFEARVWRGRTR